MLTAGAFFLQHSALKYFHMRQSDDEKFIPATSIGSGQGHQVKDDIYYYTNQIVNIIMVGDPTESKWILVDAGMPHSEKKIINAAAERFGDGNAPEAIILTHGHFDHVGSIVELIRKWNVPVYAHPLEFPYLTGEKSYPKPDTSSGGALAKISFIYPIEPIDIKEALLPLPADHTVPFLEDWQWVHTPGHTPGHVSFFRAADRMLLAGDAFVTVKQDSLYQVILQKAAVHGPPVYLTMDWTAARSSVEKLKELNPSGVISGHGRYMEGAHLHSGLDHLLQHFEEEEP
jgi:glyoxylase-like metal-dependent hydrolase (beta-lactamase superfamily II)